MGYYYTETFAPVAKTTIFRLMMALAHVLQLHLHRLDVDSAFLYADADEEIWTAPMVFFLLLGFINS